MLFRLAVKLAVNFLKPLVREKIWFRGIPATKEVTTQPMTPPVIPSVLWQCWLDDRKSIQPVKSEWWGAGVVICLERSANDLHMVQLMPLLPHHLWFH